MDNLVCYLNNYLLDSNLSIGWHYLLFEQQGHRRYIAQNIWLTLIPWMVIYPLDKVLTLI